jgi:hypothetical protein
MAAPRLVVDLTIEDEDVTKLMAIARSRTEPASRVERARMFLAYRDQPSFFAVGRLLGVHHQTVQRCIERAAALGPSVALDDSARPGRWRRSHPRPKHGSCHWPARKRRTSAIPTSCGRRGSWPAMRVNMGRPPDTNASRNWCKGPYAKFSMHMP